MSYYHIHTNVDPYCTSYPDSYTPSQMHALVRSLRGVLLKAMPAPSENCPYRLEMSEQRSLVERHNEELTILLEADAKAVVCSECGETLGDHRHPTVAAASPDPARSRSRKKPEEREPCPFCGGPMHFNDAGAKTNFECLYRQFLLSSGTITDPLRDRLPVATHVDIVEMGDWIEGVVATSPVGTLKYGKMEAASGASTFAGLRRIRTTASAPAVTTAEEVPLLTVAEFAESMAGAAFETAEEMASLVTIPEDEEAAAARKLEEVRKKDRERKATRRALLRDAGK